MSNSPEGYLERDQNFFVASPFDRLTQIAEAKKLEVIRVRGLLPLVRSYELKTGLSGLSDDEASNLVEGTQHQIANYIDVAASSGITGRLRAGSVAGRFLPAYFKFREAFGEIALHLKGFPRWDEYRLKFTGQTEPYHLDGRPNSRFHWFKDEYTPTYFRWLAEQEAEIEKNKAHEERIRDLEAKAVAIETFSQEFKDPRGRGRSWRLMRRAELIPEPGRHTLRINTKIPDTSNQSKNPDQ